MPAALYEKHTAYKGKRCTDHENVELMRQSHASLPAVKTLIIGINSQEAKENRCCAAKAVDTFTPKMRRKTL